MVALAWEHDGDDLGLDYFAGLASAAPGANLAPSPAELLAEARPRWHRRAACRGRAGFLDPGQAEASAETCRGCPVRPECEAAGRLERWGTWAGTWRCRL